MGGRFLADWLAQGSCMQHSRSVHAMITVGAQCPAQAVRDIPLWVKGPQRLYPYRCTKMPALSQYQKDNSTRSKRTLCKHRRAPHSIWETPAHQFPQLSGYFDIVGQNILHVQNSWRTPVKELSCKGWAPRNHVRLRRGRGCNHNVTCLSESIDIECQRLHSECMNHSADFERLCCDTTNLTAQ